MATHDEYYDANQGRLWIQPDGLNTETLNLGCHDVGDLTEPKGDVTQRYCPDPREAGKWSVAVTTQAPADRPTTSITVGIGPVADYLESHGDCAMPLYIHQGQCGDANAFLNFSRGVALPNATVTSVTQTNLVSRESRDMAEQTFEISSEWLLKYYKLRQVLRTSIDDQDANDVAFITPGRCMGVCGPAQADCTHGVVAYATDGATQSNVEVTHNGGVTWATRAGPYLAANHIMSIVCFEVTPGMYRTVVVRNTLAATVLQTFYSDDWGVTWVGPVAVTGSVVIEAAQWNGALFALDAQHIWLVTDDGAGAVGAIYFSNDGAVSWTAQVSSSGDALNYVRFINENIGMAVGDTDDVNLTTDGGANWALAPTAGSVGGFNVMCCDLHDQYRLWIGYSNGTLYFSNDGGTVWTQRLFSAPAGGATLVRISDIMFVNEHCGYFILRWTLGGNNRSSVYRTVNGGWSWEIYSDIAAWGYYVVDGLDAIWACDCNHAIAVGDVLTTPAIGTVLDLSS